jgi:type II secretion system protein N
MAANGGIRWGRVAAYAAFGLAVFVAAFVATFPAGQVVQRLAAVAERHTGWTVQAEGTRWAFPAGIAVARLNGTAPSGAEVALERVNVRLAPFKLRDGTLALDHDLRGYGGRATGHLDVEDAFSEPAFLWRGEVKGLALAELPPPPPDVPMAPWARGYTLDGRLDLTASAGWRGDDAARGQGKADVELTGLSVVLPRTPLGSMTLPFGQVRGEAQWQRGRVELSSLTIEGDLVRGRGSGMVLLGRTPQVTRVDLRFTGTLEAGFPMREMVTALLNLQGDEVTITLKGTLARPLLFVNGKSVDRLLAGA